MIIRDIRERKQAEQDLIKREEELKAKAEELEEANIALKVLLNQREKDKSVLENKVLQNIQEIIMPNLEKIKNSRLDMRQKSYVNILEENLNDITSPFANRLSTGLFKLTPSEMQISNFVKQGKTTKEIAELLNLSTKTIEAHRKNIRKKIGIKSKKENLRIHLMDIHDGNKTR